jgi:hypothetical protein
VPMGPIIPVANLLAPPGDAGNWDAMLDRGQDATVANDAATAKDASTPGDARVDSGRLPPRRSR